MVNASVLSVVIASARCMVNASVLSVVIASARCMVNASVLSAVIASARCMVNASVLSVVIASARCMVNASVLSAVIASARCMVNASVLSAVIASEARQSRWRTIRRPGGRIATSLRLTQYPIGYCVRAMLLLIVAAQCLCDILPRKACVPPFPYVSSRTYPRTGVPSGPAYAGDTSGNIERRRHHA